MQQHGTTAEQGAGKMVTAKADFSTVKERLTDLLRNKRTQLPTLPVVAQNIIRISRSPDTSARELAAFINNDQAIANKVLRMANSPYYGMGKKVDSILRAITIIGFDEILGLAIGIGILPSFKNSPLGSILDMRQLWLHSLGCTFAAKNIITQIRKKANGATAAQLEEKGTFLPTLLHDMGKIIFSIYFPAEYAHVLQHATDQEIALQKAEQEMLGLDHANLSALLMQHWNFPEAILMPVRFHHAPEKGDANFLSAARLIMLANSLVREAGIGNSYNAQSYEPQEIGEKFGLDSTDVQSLKTMLVNQRDEIEQFLQFIS